MKKNNTALLCLFLSACLFSISITLSAQPRNSKTPSEVLNEAVNNPGFKTSPNGEGFLLAGKSDDGRFYI